MPFSKSQYEAAESRLNTEKYSLIRKRKVAADAKSPEPIARLRKAAQKGDAKAVLSLIDADYIIKLGRRRAIYDRMDLADVLVGAKDRQVSNAEIDAYAERMEAVIRSALDNYISTGEMVDIAAVIANMRAVK